MTNTKNPAEVIGNNSTTAIDTFTDTSTNTTLRTVTLDGNPYFFAADACGTLGINTSHVRRTLDDDEVITLPNWKGKGAAPLIVTESGLYHLIMVSRKDEAKSFRKWVTSTVLPSLRKHGMYATPQTVDTMLNDPDALISILQAYKAEQEENVRLEAENKGLAIRAAHYDALSTYKGTFSMTEAMRYVAQVYPDVPTKAGFRYFRDRDWMCEKGTAPTRKGMATGVMAPTLSTRDDKNDGRICNPQGGRLTPLGVAALMDYFALEDAEKRQMALLPAD